VRTNDSQSNTPGLRLVGKDERASALSDYGPVRVGLTTSQVINREARLSELLRSWERSLEILESRYSGVLDTLEKDILVRVRRIISSLETDTTKGEDSKV
jgi:hypothetical protein